MIVLNKADLVDRDHIGRIRQWLDSRFHRYRLIEATQCNVPPEVLLSVGRYDPTAQSFNPRESGHHACADTHCSHEHRSDDHSRLFGTWSYETRHPLSLEALREAASKLPANIYRVKGVIYAADAPKRRAVLQVVGRRVDIALADEWSGRAPRTQIVAIGAADALGGEALRNTIERCVAT